MVFYAAMRRADGGSNIKIFWTQILSSRRTQRRCISGRNIQSLPQTYSIQMSQNDSGAICKSGITFFHNFIQQRFTSFSHFHSQTKMQIKPLGKLSSSKLLSIGEWRVFQSCYGTGKQFSRSEMICIHRIYEQVRVTPKHFKRSNQYGWIYVWCIRRSTLKN